MSLAKLQVFASHPLNLRGSLWKASLAYLINEKAPQLQAQGFLLRGWTTIGAGGTM
ncbi:MAG: hypothetical protein UT00_C0006G0016 [Parcubacteria group bacterium GW2011_GWA1_38_7]|nr:MAG: hypothetical protein UT00_C0006G0016 [Parcubacteria group bacterium GW2011_GWA1_38_7]